MYDPNKDCYTERMTLNTHPTFNFIRSRLHNPHMAASIPALNWSKTMNDHMENLIHPQMKVECHCVACVALSLRPLE